MENSIKCAEAPKFVDAINNSENLAEFAARTDAWANHVQLCPSCGASFLAVDSSGNILQPAHA